VTVIQRNFHIGDRPVVSCAFTDIAGAATAPTAVTVVWRHEDTAVASATTVSSPDSSIVLAATSTFTFPAALTTAGRYFVRFRGTATVIAGDEEWFQVLPSELD
jgi:hypothetical protein